MDRQRDLLVSVMWISVGVIFGVVASKLTDPMIVYGIGASTLLVFYVVISWYDHKRRV
jgi:hypothetical protein